MDFPLDFACHFPAKGQILGTVKYYEQVWQNSVCTGQGNLPLIT